MRLPRDLGEGYELVKLAGHHARALNETTLRNIERFRAWEAWAHEAQTLSHTATHVAGRLRAVEQGEAISCLIMRGTEVIGSVELRIDRGGTAGEIGYWLDADAVGRGLATGASALLLAEAQSLGLERVRLRISDRNERSLAVARRLGFSRRGTTTDAMLVGNTLHTMLTFTREFHSPS